MPYSQRPKTSSCLHQICYSVPAGDNSIMKRYFRVIPTCFESHRPHRILPHALQDTLEAETSRNKVKHHLGGGVIAVTLKAMLTQGRAIVCDKYVTFLFVLICKDFGCRSGRIREQNYNKSQG